jgi:hypothetical protein
MAIDPNIILSGNQMAQPRLPDVNAMMQTRTAGMENIYAIEQQRAEQQRTAQKEQEAAAAEAMLPSVLAAYSDASDIGLDRATSLMPSEVRDTFAPFITQLKTIPDMATRKAILEAELAKDEAGRAVLNRILTPYQEGTLGIQRGQLELSQAELEQRRAEANQPEAMTPYQEAQIQIEREKLASTKKTETAEEVKKRLADEKRVKDLGLAVSEIERAMTPGGLIDSATGGYLSNLFDTAAAVFSMGTDSSAALARLAPIADLALKMVPRFEGPQSNYDVQAYKDAAGNLANPNVPASTKRAAAGEIVRLFKKYKDQFEYAGDAAGGAGGGAGGAGGGAGGGAEDPLGIR